MRDGDLGVAARAPAGGGDGAGADAARGDERLERLLEAALGDVDRGAAVDGVDLDLRAVRESRFRVAKSRAGGTGEGKGKGTYGAGAAGAGRGRARDAQELDLARDAGAGGEQRDVAVVRAEFL